MKFDKMMNGYNRYQVDMAVSKLEEQVDALTKNVETYRKQSEEDKKKIEALEEKLREQKKDLEIKERAAQQMAEIAMSEANRILNNANMNADQIVKEAVYCAQAILENVSRLGVEAQGVKEHMNEQILELKKVVDDFDVPPIPGEELLKKSDE